jgi:8-oxo-dGTP pyrophosphatase MutT (NUDIX family)
MSLRVSLFAALETYRPEDSVEAQHLERMQALGSGLGDPFRRDHFVPGHFTASAFVLSPARDALLLVHHAKLERWLQPGGHVEASDATMLAAARREVLEETGLDQLVCSVFQPFDLDVHEIPGRAGEPEHEHFDVRFLFRAAREEHRRSEESLDVRWFRLEELHEAPFDDSLMRAVRKLKRIAEISV